MQNSRQTKRRTLKKTMTNYILKKGDVCCEKDIDRKKVIEDIFSIYEEIAEFMFEKELYLEYVQNDILVFIGYRIELEKGNNKEGVMLWDGLSRLTMTDNTLDKNKITRLLKNVPLYYLLSFLGYATYKNRRNQAIVALNKK
jgi:hypothetical protein